MMSTIPNKAKSEIASMIRVDHAGEFGAARIYAGQLHILGPDHPSSGEIQRMADQEQRHLDVFDKMVRERNVRPTIMAPVWDAAGFALGAVTALMGPKAAMACTAAVEEVIDAHYQSQKDTLADQPDESELHAVIDEFQADEAEHRQTALDHGAEETPGYGLLSAAIRTGCRVAIEVSKRV